MSDTPAHSADKLVSVYIKMRDKRDAMVREHEEKLNALKEQMEIVEAQLLEICKTTGQDGGKTAHGTFTRTVKTRYWTNDWAAMHKFIREHNAIELLEQRLHQGNFKQFLQENPDEFPEGLNVDAKYSILVRRKSA